MMVRYIFSFITVCNLINLHAQPDQELVYGSYYGVANSEFEYDVIRDITETPTGGFAIYGLTQSPSGLATISAYQTTSNGMNDCFLSMFDENRNRLWSTYFGGSQQDTPIRSVEALSDGSLVIAGVTASSDDISTDNAFQPSIVQGSSSGFLTRFSEDGFPVWSTYFGTGTGAGNTIAEIRDFVVLLNDDIVVVGYTLSSSLQVSQDAFQSEHAGSFDGFIARFSSAGELVWSTYFGGPGSDHIHVVEFDSDGNIVLLGTTESDSDIATSESHQSTIGGDVDLFLAKLSPTGNMMWSTYFGGEAEERGNNLCDLAIDEEDNIYILSRTESSTGIVTDGAYQTDLLEEGELSGNTLLARFSPSGSLMWGSYFGIPEVAGRALEVHEGKLILAGNTGPNSEVVFGDAWQESFPGATNSSVFITAFTQDGEPAWGTYYGGEGQDAPTNLQSFSGNVLALTGSTNSSSGIPTPDGFQTQNLNTDGFFSFFQINEDTGISDHKVFEMSVFPNPTRNAVQLNLPPEFVFRADVTVYNSVGQIVAQYGNYNALQRLPMNHPTGMYIVEARNSNRVARSKVIVE